MAHVANTYAEPARGPCPLGLLDERGIEARTIEHLTRKRLRGIRRIVFDEGRHRANALLHGVREPGDFDPEQRRDELRALHRTARLASAVDGDDATAAPRRGCGRP
jgi:hypothetical protein